MRESKAANKFVGKEIESTVIVDPRIIQMFLEAYEIPEGLELKHARLIKKKMRYPCTQIRLENGRPVHAIYEDRIYYALQIKVDGKWVRPKQVIETLIR